MQAFLDHPDVKTWDVAFLENQTQVAMEGRYAEQHDVTCATLREKS